MDRNVIENIIKYSGGTCPSLRYENPLLDKNVADQLSMGFLNLLNDPNPSDHRRLVLQNIRKSCKIEPPEHLSIDDNVIELLRHAYERHLTDYNINKLLDSFLIRNLKEMNINTVYPSSFKPDIIQALTNLNRKKQEIPDILLKDIIYWNVDNNQNNYIDILKSMWNMDVMSKIKTQSDDISIKIKPLIEKQLLQCTFETLETVIIDEEEWFSENKDLNRLVEICSVSSDCFQICCSIINSIFIKTNFDLQMQNFITRFINAIKLQVVYISQLYQSNNRHIVLLLDIDLENLDAQVKKEYIESTLKHLHDLHKECDNNVIMLLTHFNNWFDLYYDYIKNKDPL